MITLYNTRTRRTEEFRPLNPEQISLYTCGPTVYNYVHLGNLRTYIFEDILRRVLEYNGFRVKQVMNITDVGHLTSNADTGEDKIEKAAQEQRRDARTIAAEYTVAFWEDIDRLNIQRPQVVVAASSDAAIQWQIALVKKLERKGYTYRTSDGIYFNTDKFPAYGKLSGQSVADKKAGARVGIRDEKKQPEDFALWKFSPLGKKRQMEWEAFDRKGFPGWHIECSAIAMHELGDQFDIHTGGIDHISIHHENEIAQSEAASGKHPFVNFWLHGEFLILPEKRMGKSEGNAVTLAAFQERGIDPLAFRYLTLQSHYRSPLTFTWEAVRAADVGLRRLWQTVTRLSGPARIGCAEFEDRFRAAINDDLNSPQALAVLQSLLDSDYPASAKLSSINKFDAVLGLHLASPNRRPEAKVPAGLRRQVAPLLTERARARKNGQWAKADSLRQQINELLAPAHLTLRDHANGASIERV